MRAVSVPFSPARPSRLKKEPGILPAAYMRSSTSTVSGRKSTSRWLPAVAVQSTTVSPWRTTTDPEACLASLPVSNVISSPEISTETVVTPSLLLIQLSLLPSDRSRGASLLLVGMRTASGYRPRRQLRRPGEEVQDALVVGRVEGRDLQAGDL